MCELSDKEIDELKKKVPLLIGNRIVFLRKKQNITQITLAKRTGKDRQYIYKIEKGKVTPNIVTIACIATALGLTLAEFFREV